MAAPYPVCEEVEPQAAAIEEVETRLNKLGKSKPVDLSAFSWLQWSPPTDSKCGQPTTYTLPLARSGLTAENTIYGQSICPDEINNEKGDLATLMADHWGECFPMGGIGGAPFVGKTGFGAFSHHVPDDGHIIILFGPHIAISDEGELGKYLREGQVHESTACGAVLGAYAACKCGQAGEFDEMDMQQSWLKQRINRRFGEIESSDDQMKALIHVAYEAVKEKLLGIINTDFGSGKLILVGGIQINMPKPWEDHFQPLYYKVHQKGAEPVDILDDMCSF
ncbi:hypothetical protein EMIHUDRAFT_234190 [Emiliania huxleyi CCMP1516]|uniref:Limiting CO2-inducible protein B/C beta carbonyic anhydrase domain-containing protein n=2 Tax=Emiliania huxleyi TaxID=2903 RepID=A0A0D3K010_EMIH1|nr:hypothetical protein EMIHUDRAFT_244082 [Emiliania huxleyi CCMP1516]XP_005781524.1 hypothetical protein EMIHUDRAFT_234190 [Emiliania huxleyi CCMP1516]EOD17527.1 hypothetical protein EMIHUDRAFT_244082 [Emiliania huxleyi CCMP1516]EOD29095.1 hypothetical protein EMIHUDRAFT_234190 [Emiliania huxleyi CCMP1516]|eukprot:XP_005769956.1 hypothetical protein EMIHUDRAFT_244082 [Emiliania huxleyi CCMP1516]